MSFLQNNVDETKGLQKKETKTLPNWAYLDGLKVKAYPDALGHAILKENDYFYTKSIDNATSKIINLTGSVID